MLLWNESRILVIGLVLICAILGALGQLFFKIGSASISPHPIYWIKNPSLLIGAFLYLIAAILFITALRHENLSILYPVLATSYIWVTVLSTLVLGESFPPIKWLGIGLIISGIILIVR